MDVVGVRAQVTAAQRAELDRLDRLASLMDAAFRVPGTSLRFGFDSLVGLLPGLGDAATTVPAAWIMMRAAHLGAPKSVLLRMAVNSGLDLVVGAIPLLGDLFDAGFKANRRNVAVLRQHLEGIAVRSAAQGLDPR